MARTGADGRSTRRRLVIGSVVVVVVAAGAATVWWFKGRSSDAAAANDPAATVSRVVDVTTGTIKLRAIYDNKDGKLFPNQFVNIQLIVNVLHDQTVMPGAAVRRGCRLFQSFCPLAIKSICAS